jgi:hypothetical protein
MEKTPKKCEACKRLFVPRYRVTAEHWAKRRFCSKKCIGIGKRGEHRSTFRKEKVSLADRFWRKVERAGEQECWIWRGATTALGYGKIAGTRGEKDRNAHRVSYELHHGVTLSSEQCVCHKCDNPPHLFLGTKSENFDDMRRKGRERKAKGEGNGQAKLTAENVRDARRSYTSGETQASIAVRLGVSQTAISSIVRGRTWKRV